MKHKIWRAAAEASTAGEPVAEQKHNIKKHRFINFWDLITHTDTWQIFGPTIEYIAIHSVLTEYVGIT